MAAPSHRTILTHCQLQAILTPPTLHLKRYPRWLPLVMAIATLDQATLSPRDHTNITKPPTKANRVTNRHTHKHISTSNLLRLVLRNTGCPVQTLSPHRSLPRGPRKQSQGLSLCLPLLVAGNSRMSPPNPSLQSVLRRRLFQCQRFCVSISVVSLTDIRSTVWLSSNNRNALACVVLVTR